jgi:hypothetical protein
VYDVIGWVFTPPAAMGANVVTGTGTSSPKLALAVIPSVVRRWGLASARVAESFFSSR